MAAHERDDAPAGASPAPSLGERLASLERIVTRQQEELLAQREELAAQRALSGHQQERLVAQQEEIVRLRAEQSERAEAALATPAPLLARGRGAAGEDGRIDGAPGSGVARRGSRRNLLKLGGAAAAAGVAAGAIELWRPGAAHAAPRNDGDTMFVGTFMHSTNTTWLVNDAVSGTNGRVTIFLDVSTNPRGTVEGYTSGLTSRSEGSIGVLGVTGNSELIAPPAKNVLAGSYFGYNVGLYGLANTLSGNGGYGVVAHSINGNAPLAIVPSGISGATDKGIPLDGSIWADANGAVWNARYGTWYPLSSVNLLPVPIRLLDTRAGAPVGFSLPGAPIPYHGTLQMRAAGLTFQSQTIPAGATAVFGNLVVALAPGVDPGDGSSLICWPNGQPRPAAVNVVFNPGDLKGEYTSTFTLVAIGTGNLVNIYNQPINAGVAVDVIFDAFGFVV